MSFSGNVKEELSRRIPGARHCQIAEIAAMASLCGKVEISVDDQYCFVFHTEHIAVARKCFTLLKEAFQIRAEIAVRRNTYLKKVRAYRITVCDHEDAMRLLRATRLIRDDGEIQEELSLSGNLIVQQVCCKRAFIRGAFLAAGSISNPGKYYHFEVVCAAMEKAGQLRELIQYFGIEAKIVRRKRSAIVYVKESAQIVDILNVMEAPLALMELENIRIYKDMRNDVNRKVNCETANINKTVSAAVKQVQDIHSIQEIVGLDTLSDGLRQIALARLEYTDIPLKELGDLLSPPVGKSGVNHRLRKIGEIAENLRQQCEK
jgi:DNA-binding protein WhiA